MTHATIGTRLQILVLAVCLTVTAVAARPDVARAATSLTVTSPDGGEEFVADGSLQKVTWKTSAKSDHRFHYFLIPQDDTPILPPPPPGGSSVAFLEDFGGYSVGGAAVFSPATSHSGTIILDSDLPEGDYTLRIYATQGDVLMEPNDAAFFGESDEPFTIDNVRPNTPSIRLVTPSGGEVWRFGAPQILRWESKGVGGMQLALQNLSTGQPCTIATNINARSTAWLIIPVLGAPCMGSPTQRVVAGEYKAALYDNNWLATRVSAYSDEPFTLSSAKASGSDIERLTELINILTEILTALRAAR